MATGQDVEATIRRVAAELGFTDPDLLVATARQESGLRPAAVGDSGHSVGVFQEHDRGRGAGLSVAQRQDVEAATRRAIREFSAIRTKHPDVSRGAWAALAQRPLDAPGYAKSVNALLESSPSPATGGPGVALAGRTDGNAPAWYRDLAQGQGASDLAFRYGRDEGPGVEALPNPPTRAAAGSNPSWYTELLSAGGQVAGAVGRGVQGLTDAAGAVWPVVGQRVGQVNNPFGGQQARSAGATVALPSSNVGADLTANYGADVVAPVSGTVLQVFDAPDERDRNLNSGWGGMTLLRGDDGYTYRLSHAKPGSIGVQPGQRVRAGDYLQKIGVSGNTTGAHLDLEKFDRPGHFVDPVATMGQRVSTVAAAPRQTAGAGAGEPDWYRELMGGR